MKEKHWFFIGKCLLAAYLLGISIAICWGIFQFVLKPSARWLVGDSVPAATDTAKVKHNHSKK